MDQNGAILKETAFGSGRFNNIIQTSYGGYLMVGTTEARAGNSDFYVVKTEKYGDVN